MSVTTPNAVVETAGVTDGVAYVPTRFASGVVARPMALVEVEDIPRPFASEAEIEEATLG